MRPLLLDTCALIRVAAGHPISAEAEREIDAVAGVPDGIGICPISVWEVGLLVARGRLSMALTPRAMISTVLAQPGVRLTELSVDILLDSATLPGDPPRDPADRMIIATARALGLRIVTRDSRMIDYSRAGFVRVVPC